MTKGKLRLYIYAGKIAQFSSTHTNFISHIVCNHLVATGPLVLFMLIAVSQTTTVHLETTQVGLWLIGTAQPE